MFFGSTFLKPAKYLPGKHFIAMFAGKQFTVFVDEHKLVKHSVKHSLCSSANTPYVRRETFISRAVVYRQYERFGSA